VVQWWDHWILNLLKKRHLVIPISSILGEILYLSKSPPSVPLLNMIIPCPLAIHTMDTYPWLATTTISYIRVSYTGEWPWMKRIGQKWVWGGGLMQGVEEDKIGSVWNWACSTAYSQIQAGVVNNRIGASISENAVSWWSFESICLSELSAIAIESCQ
jgi:hypothetical protein